MLFFKFNGSFITYLKLFVWDLKKKKIAINVCKHMIFVVVAQSTLFEKILKVNKTNDF